MATVTIDNPEAMDEKKVDQSGKLYVGNQWAGKDVRFVIESVSEHDSEN